MLAASGWTAPNVIREGRSVICFARRLGHGANPTMSTYGYVIEELEDAPRRPAEEAIRRARDELGGRCLVGYQP